MKYLIYLSSAVRLMPEADLLSLLNNARERNKKHHITGLLLYSDGTFIQVLEGAEEDVDLIFSSIEKDKRHKNIIKLIEQPLEKRNFADWSMGFSSITAALSQEVLGYINSTDTIMNNNSKHSAISVLKTFIATNNLIIKNR